MRSSIIPCLSYADAPRAIDFLCGAFGFARGLCVPGDGSAEIVHAQLVMDGNMIMLNTAKPASREQYGMVTPAEAGGLVTGCLYVTLDDPDAHCARASASGAQIIAPPHDNDYGGRSYEACDPEGNVWSFGSYDPWAAPPIPT